MTDKVVKEFPRVGGYRVRLIERASATGTSLVLDIREHLQNSRFEGFTRRGIRLQSPQEFDALLAILEDVKSVKTQHESPAKDRSSS